MTATQSQTAKKSWTNAARLHKTVGTSKEGPLPDHSTVKYAREFLALSSGKWRKNFTFPNIIRQFAATDELFLEVRRHYVQWLRNQQEELLLFQSYLTPTPTKATKMNTTTPETPTPETPTPKTPETKKAKMVKGVQTSWDRAKTLNNYSDSKVSKSTAGKARKFISQHGNYTFNKGGPAILQLIDEAHPDPTTKTLSKAVIRKYRKWLTAKNRTKTKPKPKLTTAAKTSWNRANTLHKHTNNLSTNSTNTAARQFLKLNKQHTINNRTIPQIIDDYLKAPKIKSRYFDFIDITNKYINWLNRKNPTPKTARKDPGGILPISPMETKPNEKNHSETKIPLYELKTLCTKYGGIQKIENALQTLKELQLE